MPRRGADGAEAASVVGRLVLGLFVRAAPRRGLFWLWLRLHRGLSCRGGDSGQSRRWRDRLLRFLPTDSGVRCLHSSLTSRSSRSTPLSRGHPHLGVYVIRKPFNRPAEPPQRRLRLFVLTCRPPGRRRPCLERRERRVELAVLHDPLRSSIYLQRRRPRSSVAGAGGAVTSSRSETSSSCSTAGGPGRDGRAPTHLSENRRSNNRSSTKRRARRPGSVPLHVKTT
jgi:hypothetical protein